MDKFAFKLRLLVSIVLVLAVLVPAESIAAFKSFGGSRSSSSRPSGSTRSFGGTRPSTKPSTGTNKSFGGTRTQPGSGNQGSLMGSGKSFGGARNVSPSLGSKGTAGTQANPTSTGSSFGGARSAKSQQMQAKYGTPRRQVPQSELPPNTPSNYIVNDYGGFGHGLMLGYLAGSTPFMWSTPFHPAFYYSRPTYVYNDDGTVEVYPPTFQFGRMLLTIFVLGIVVAVVYIIVRNRRRSRGSMNQSSFS